MIRLKRLEKDNINIGLYGMIKRVKNGIDYKMFSRGRQKKASIDPWKNKRGKKRSGFSPQWERSVLKSA